MIPNNIEDNFWNSWSNNRISKKDEFLKDHRQKFIEFFQENRKWLMKRDQIQKWMQRRAWVQIYYDELYDEDDDDDVERVRLLSIEKIKSSKNYIARDKHDWEDKMDNMFFDLP